MLLNSGGPLKFDAFLCQWGWVYHLVLEIVLSVCILGNLISQILTAHQEATQMYQVTFLFLGTRSVLLFNDWSHYFTNCLLYIRGLL